ncbi:MAG TPA: ribosome small subunit-dependent GTPase A [Mycobacteriales bacterium]|nr:ribosome small subunit-dependent GTPase A [Mycobacteriales bacterium]
MSANLASVGWDEQFAAEFEPYHHTHVAARVSRVDRGAAELISEAGPLRVELSRAHGELTVGDWVAIADGQVDAILTRRTAIVRASPTGQSSAQALVANIDHVLVVVPAIPRPRLGMVERLVALAWDSGASPVVVVTKIDVSPDPERVSAEIAEAAPGCDLVLVSAVTGEGMADVAGYDRPGRSLCLVGRSGAGKSTLANALLGVDHMAVFEVRQDGKGRHTTTHRELMSLPGGGVLIDTPGLRGVGMWIADDGVAQTFPEIESMMASCRFSDCRHDSEPGCAVLAAVEEGSLPQRRLDSWRKLGREAEWIASRSDARLRQEQQRVWKLRSAQTRRSGRIRP